MLKKHLVTHLFGAELGRTRHEELLILCARIGYNP